MPLRESHVSARMRVAGGGGQYGWSLYIAERGKVRKYESGYLLFVLFFIFFFTSNVLFLFSMTILLPFWYIFPQS